MRRAAGERVLSRAIVALVLAAACKEPVADEPPPPSKPEARPPSPPDGIEPVRVHMTGLAAALAAVAETCKDTCCVERLPQWDALRRTSLVQLGEPELRLVLRWLVEHPASPLERALALRWLAAIGHAEDVAVIEAALDDAREAWRAPTATLAQRAGPCGPLSGWEPVSVQRVALQGLASTTGKHATTVEEYRQWRARFEDVRDSLQYWDARVPTTGREECLDATLPMMQHDPALLLRLALARADRRPPGDGTPCPSLEAVRGAREAYGKPSLLALVLEPKAWTPSPEPTYRDATDWPALTRWVLGNAARTLDPDDAQALDQVAALPAVAKDPALLALVAAAKVQLDPEHHVELVDGALDELVDPPSSLLSTLARLRPESLGASRWLRPGATCHDGRRAAAVLAGLAEAGAAGRTALARHAADPATDLAHRPDHARALGQVAMNLGGEGADLYACSDLEDPRCDERTEEERAEIDAENARQLPACVRGIATFFAR